MASHFPLPYYEAAQRKNAQRQPINSLVTVVGERSINNPNLIN
jgi:hypothetical protein